MTPNEILHEAMGMCIHEWSSSITASRGMPYRGPRYQCLRDGCDAGTMDNTKRVPDYSQPENIGKVYAFMETLDVHQDQLWYAFSRWYKNRSSHALIHFITSPSTERIFLLSEWMLDAEWIKKGI